MSSSYSVRRATVGDANIIGHHRAEMFFEMGEVTAADVPALESASRAQLVGLIASGEYLGWVAEADGQVIAGAGVMVRRLLPRGRQLGDRAEAYVLNVYTAPAHRRRGIARDLMAQIIDWSRQQGLVRVALHASAAGQSVYESLGFGPTNEMKLTLAPHPR